MGRARIDTRAARLAALAAGAAAPPPPAPAPAARAAAGGAAHWHGRAAAKRLDNARGVSRCGSRRLVLQ